MTSLRTFVMVAVPLLSSVSVIGCATPRMAPPSDIAGASEVELAYFGWRQESEPLSGRSKSAATVLLSTRRFKIPNSPAGGSAPATPGRAPGSREANHGSPSLSPALQAAPPARD